jgi:hypothetical protein
MNPTDHTKRKTQKAEKEKRTMGNNGPSRDASNTSVEHPTKVNNISAA